jgi:hypothetical protein
LQRLELALQMIKAIEKERNAMALGKAPSMYGNAQEGSAAREDREHRTGDCHNAGR